MRSSGRYIFCPADNDKVVRRAVSEVPASPFRGVLRSKGWCWVTDEPTRAGLWSHAGRSVELSKEGMWWGAAGDANMRQSLGSGSRYEEAKSHFEGPYGDCRQELVFIGVEPMDEAVIRKALDDCLIQSKKELADFEKAWAASSVVAVAPKETSPLAWWQKGLKGLL